MEKERGFEIIPTKIEIFANFLPNGYFLRRFF
jgi:hypothetical protein